MFQFPQPPPLALYAHVPWCIRKCPYCDFNSHALKESLPAQEYVDALLRDLDGEMDTAQRRPLVSIFLGGGTPSLLPADAVARLLEGVRKRMVLAPGCEITLEANPGVVEHGQFAELREAGVNRLSLGVQSFDDSALVRLGRIHSGAEAIRALERAHDAGFERINLDLMFGLPEQSLAAGLRDLRTALALAPAHLSWYQLTLEPNTLFHRQPPALPDDDTVWELQEQGQALLAEHGLVQYEVSAYARPGEECRHNLNYWTFGDYLGIGAGAHGKLSDAAQGAIERRAKTRHPSAYLAAAPRGEALSSRWRLSVADAVTEFMMNALRLTGGFDPALMAERSGLPRAQFRPGLEAAQAQGLLACSDTRVHPTTLGRRFLNDLVALFCSP